MTCRICGNTENNCEFRAREMQFGTREEFVYFQCDVCGCLQIAEIPSDMSKYYPSDDYYSIQPLDERKYIGVRGFFRVSPLEVCLFPNFPLRWALSKLVSKKHFSSLKDLGVQRGTKVLDVGCGNGKSLLYPLKRMGFEEVAGCDPFIPEDIRYANGLLISAKSVTEMDGSANWDLITFHHSFEHIPNPIDTIKAVCRLMTRDGLCLIRIPTSSSFAWEHYGVHWVQLDAPRHLFLHSVDSIRRLAGIANLELVKIAYDSNYFQFWGSENYIKGIPLKDQKKGKGLRKIGWVFRKWLLNQKASRLNRESRGDQAAFVLRKAASR